MTYTYDALDNRIGREENGTQTWSLYDGSTPVMDFTSSGSLATRYLNGPAGDLIDTVLARESANGTVAWYLPDRLGTIRDLINNSGSIIDHVDYSAFGTVLDESSPSNGDRMMGFAGMERDTVTGLNLAVERVENAGTARWLSKDPLGFKAGDLNLYRYVDNRPTNLIDPTGRDVWGTLGGAATGGLVGGGSGALIGAGIGSFGGPPGTLIGGIVGGGIGLIGGAIWGGMNGSSQQGVRNGIPEGVGPGLICGVGGGLIGGGAGIVGGPLLAGGSVGGGGAAAAAGAGTAGGGVLVRPGGALDQIITALEAAFRANPPCNRDEAMQLVSEVTQGLGYEPGQIINLQEYMSGGPAIYQNVGNVLTQIMPDGTIIITKGGQVVSQLTAH